MIIRYKILYLLTGCFILLNPLVLSAYELDFTYTGAKLISSDSSREVYKKANGTVINKFRDREVAVLSDKTRIIRYSNGKREVYPPDGVKIYINFDGSVKYIYTDGKEKFISMDGKTPYGIVINDHKKTFHRNR